MKREAGLVILLLYSVVAQSQLSEEIDKILEELQSEAIPDMKYESSTLLSLEPFAIGNEVDPTEKTALDSKSGGVDKTFSLNPYEIPVNGTIGTSCKHECVVFYQCNNGTLNKHGETLIDIRQNDGPCGNAFLTCCQHENLITQTSTVSSSEFIPKGCGYRNPDGVGFKITGTREGESQFAEFPWVVAIMRDMEAPEVKTRPNCGGALIHPRAVITAAHCVSDKTERWRVRAGEWDIIRTIEPYQHQDVSVESVIIHENFYSGALFNDIAFLLLKDPVRITANVNTICLPPKSYSQRSNKKCFSTGWGKDKFKGEYQLILKKVELPVVPREVCQQNLQKTRLGRFFELHASFMCAGGEKDKDSCNGDGGSPLICPIEGEAWRYHHAGIVSWGIGCGEENVPGVYTDVALFRDWIDEQMIKYGLETSSYDQNIGLEPRFGHEA